MARGAQSKEDATQKILNLFPGSFIYEKEIRIPYKEDGEDIQLKCTLTCAKVNVGQDDDIAIPGEIKTAETNDSAFVEPTPAAQPTQEEKDNVRKLLESFGL